MKRFVLPGRIDIFSLSYDRSFLLLDYVYFRRRKVLEFFFFVVLFLRLCEEREGTAENVWALRHDLMCDRIGLFFGQERRRKIKRQGGRKT